MTTFWFAAVMGALCFTAAGYLFRAWQERGWKENARPGYLPVAPKDAVDNWCCDPPYDQELQQIADVMDVARGDVA